MARLGTFGGPAPRDLEVNDFVYFGQVIRLQPGASDLAYVDFMERASSLAMPEGLEELQVEAAEDGQVDPGKVAELATAAGDAAGAIKGLLRELIHEEDFDLFWRTARRSGQRIEDLMGFAWELLGAVAERDPTRPRSGSSSTRSKPGRGGKRNAGSKAGRTGRVIRRLEEAGRPDLAVAVLSAREARDAAQAG